MCFSAARSSSENHTPACARRTRQIGLKRAARRRKRYDAFIQTVPLLHHLEAHERGMVADAFKERDYEDGEAALTAGESVNNL